METIGGIGKNLRLFSRADLQRKQLRECALEGAEDHCANESQIKKMFPDLIRNLAVILLKPGHDSLRLSEVAPVRV
jgi:hypothetical protein